MKQWNSTAPYHKDKQEQRRSQYVHRKVCKTPPLLMVDWINRSLCKYAKRVHKFFYAWLSPYSLGLPCDDDLMNCKKASLVWRILCELTFAAISSNGPLKTPNPSKVTRIRLLKLCGIKAYTWKWPNPIWSLRLCHLNLVRPRRIKFRRPVSTYVRQMRKPVFGKMIKFSIMNLYRFSAF